MRKRVLLWSPMFLLLSGCHLGWFSRDTPAASVGTAAAPSIPQIGDEIDLGANESYIESNTLGAVSSLLARLPREDTLVVFDIDDTLLTTPFVDGNAGAREFFGSDSWYVWQSDLPATDPHRQACRFVFLGLNFEAAIAVSTPLAAETVAAVANDKLMLTSRSPDYRGGTERELKRAGIPFPPSIAPQPALSVMLNGKPLSYVNGILMTRGANKGEALRALLATAGRVYSDVVLVDDGWKNILDMSDASRQDGRRFHGVLYTGVKRDHNAGNTDRASWKKFTLADADAKAADKAWTRWLKSFGQLYPERARLLDAEHDCK